MIRLRLLRLHRRMFSAALLVLFFAAGFAAPAAAQFETRSSVSIFTLMESLAVGDFNHDGNLDVAVAMVGPGLVQIFLGNGDGTFQPSISYLYPDGAVWVASADLNRDGNLDLVVASGGAVYVQLGNGDGTFQPPVSYATTDGPSFVGVGDFNGDHKPDLIVVDPPYVSVLLGNGDGTFQAPIDTDTTSVDSAGWGDFNHDGKLDLAITRNAGFVQDVVVYLGNGDGTFNQGASYAMPEPPGVVAVSDFNGDGNADLAVGLEFDEISVLLGNGDGTFRQGQSYPVGFPDGVLAADVNRDGKQDLVVSNFSTPSGGLLGSVSVLLGNGDGTFQPQRMYPTVDEPAFVAVGDFNNDGQLDLVDLGHDIGTVMVLLNTGVVGFSPTTALTFPPQFVGKVGAPLRATLTNAGTAALSISSISVDSPFRLSKLTTCGESVEPGGTCEIVVTFKPQTSGLFTGAVNLRDSASSKEQVIELIGSGTLVTVSPDQLNFAPQKLLTSSPPQNVTVTNHSTAAVDVTEIFVMGPEAFDFNHTDHCGSQIGPGASCTVTVIFAPYGMGKQGAVLYISVGGMGDPLEVVLRGTGK